jgi:NADH:ubiquinone reductase (H+-translocating)
LARALNDFARGVLADYQHLRPEDLRIILVQARERILPELSDSLAAYALERMAAGGSPSSSRGASRMPDSAWWY